MRCMMKIVVAVVDEDMGTSHEGFDVTWAMATYMMNMENAIT